MAHSDIDTVKKPTPELFSSPYPYSYEEETSHAVKLKSRSSRRNLKSVEAIKDAYTKFSVPRLQREGSLLNNMGKLIIMLIY